jgi:hypothetical protein
LKRTATDNSVIQRKKMRQGATRANGSIIVGVAVIGITSVLAVSQVYLPFYADRDALSGSKSMSKEEQRREMAMAMRNQPNSAGAKQQAISEGASPELIEAQKSKAAGSMWANINIRGKQN